MKRSNYLGYKYKDELSILISRITLYLNKEIKFTFFDKTWIDFHETNEEKVIQGFVLSRYYISLDKALELTKDLECIHVNKHNYNSQESCFVICSEKAILQKWYQIMYEGTIARRMISKFGSNLDKGTRQERDLFRQQLHTEIELLTV